MCAYEASTGEAATHKNVWVHCKSKASHGAGKSSLLLTRFSVAARAAFWYLCRCNLPNNARFFILYICARATLRDTLPIYLCSTLWLSACCQSALTVHAFVCAFIKCLWFMRRLLMLSSRKLDSCHCEYFLLPLKLCANGRLSSGEKMQRHAHAQSALVYGCWKYLRSGKNNNNIATKQFVLACKNYADAVELFFTIARFSEFLMFTLLLFAAFDHDQKRTVRQLAHRKTVLIFKNIFIEIYFNAAFMSL